MLKLALLTFLAFVPVCAIAGPFGIEQETKKDQLNVLEEIKPFLYKVSPPNPHPRFEIYVVKLHPKTGVCLLSAVGVTISTSVYGTEIRSWTHKHATRYELRRA